MTIIDQAGRAGNGLLYRPPPQALEPVVREGWIQRFSEGIRREPRGWRIVPDVQPTLLFHRLMGGRSVGPRLVGARSVYVDVRADERLWSAGVTLRPGSLPALTGVSATELRDRSVDATDLWGARGRRLAEEVRRRTGADEVLASLFRFLAMALEAPGDAVDWRVRGLRVRGAEAGGHDISRIAADLSVSPRTLREVWTREVGLSPRHAVAIERIHRAVRRALESPGPTWSRIAVSSGYYDQAHLIRDFHRLLGETPVRFLARGRPMGR